jgi:hypothetical protein
MGGNVVLNARCNVAAKLVFFLFCSLTHWVKNEWKTLETSALTYLRSFYRAAAFAGDAANCTAIIHLSYTADTQKGYGGFGSGSRGFS